MTRAEDGTLAAWVNRCAHRGAAVCRLPRGNALSHSCVYHQWNYGATGNLQGVPFRRGQKDMTGMPKDFDPKQHNLQQAAGGQLPRPGVRHLQRHGGGPARVYRPADAPLGGPHLLQADRIPRLHPAILQVQLEAVPGEREGPVSRQPAAPVPHHVQHLPRRHAGAASPTRATGCTTSSWRSSTRRDEMRPAPTRRSRSAPTTTASGWRTTSVLAMVQEYAEVAPTTSSRSSRSW